MREMCCCATFLSPLAFSVFSFIRLHAHQRATHCNPPPHSHPVPPFTTHTHRFESGKTDLHNAVWAGHDPVAHTKRLAKLAVRIQRESPEDWEEIQRVEGLIAKLEGVELR